MSADVEVVRLHLAALGRFDWAALQSSISEDAVLRLVGLEGWDWAVGNLYRQVTQAWDYMPADVRLSDEGNGVVRAEIRLSNGGAVKDIEGEYRVFRDRIEAIVLTDGRSATAS